MNTRRPPRTRGIKPLTLITRGRISQRERHARLTKRSTRQGEIPEVGDSTSELTTRISLSIGLKRCVASCNAVQCDVFGRRRSRATRMQKDDCHYLPRKTKQITNFTPAGSADRLQRLHPTNPRLRLCRPLSVSYPANKGSVVGVVGGVRQSRVAEGETGVARATVSSKRDAPRPPRLHRLHGRSAARGGGAQ